MEKAAVEYSPNVKDVVQVEYTPMIYGPNGKGMVL